MLKLKNAEKYVCKRALPYCFMWRCSISTRTLTAAAMFAMCVPAYGKKYGVDAEEMREVLAHISAKNHYNGARNPRAQFRREVSAETICNSPLMAGDLRVFDCSDLIPGNEP